MGLGSWFAGSKTPSSEDIADVLQRMKEQDEARQRKAELEKNLINLANINLVGKQEEPEVRITKEYVIIFTNREPLMIVADDFEFNSDENIYYFYDEDGDEIAAFDRTFVVGVALTTGSTIQNFGVQAPVPALPAPPTSTIALYHKTEG